MPAHVTVLYPFLPEQRLDATVIGQLREVCAAVPAQDVSFRQTGRFPGVLYLAPEPASGFRDLTTAIAERWPETPPYGGAFDEIIPHLTVAHSVGEDVLDEVAAELHVRLPVQSRLLEAALFVFDGEQWQLQERLPFRGDLTRRPGRVPRQTMEQRLP